MIDLRTSLIPPAARLVVPFQVAFAVFLLLRGHNLPGGGFIGGLVLASALVLRKVARPDRALPLAWTRLTGGGLLVAAAAGVAPMLAGKPFFTGLWGGSVWLPLLGDVKLGTPLLFDIGVFLIVTGVAARVLLLLFSLTETPEDAPGEPPPRT